MSVAGTGRLWAIVLAGGDGRRVSALTRGEAGEPVPKQYFALGGGPPLVRRALRRAAAVVPRSRILVVVAREHRQYWSEALFDLPRENVIVQPRNRGTAVGLLLPALEVLLRRDRDARLLVLPADHHVGSERVLKRALNAAARAVRAPGSPVVLLGMAGVEDDHEFGWILPTAGPAEGLRPVLSFVEKPDPDTARELRGMGALVNSFIIACRGRALVGLYEESLPELLRALTPLVLAGRPEPLLGETYAVIPSRDLSRAVLERRPDALGVLGVPPCGWSDLGTPPRLEQYLGRPRPNRAPPPETAVVAV